jgi:hypothetical protein
LSRLTDRGGRGYASARYFDRHQRFTLASQNNPKEK